MTGTKWSTLVLCFLLVEVLMLFTITVVVSAASIPLLLLVQALERFLP